MMYHPISQTKHTHRAWLQNGGGNRELLIGECLPSSSHGYAHPHHRLTHHKINIYSKLNLT